MTDQANQCRSGIGNCHPRDEVERTATASTRQMTTGSVAARAVAYVFQPDACTRSLLTRI